MTTALNPFGIIPDGESLFFVNEKDRLSNQPNIYFALERAARHDAQAVFFRNFDDQSRPPKPEVYIFFLNDWTTDNADIAEKVRKVWNEGIVPQCYFFTPKEARFYNSLDADIPKKGQFEPKILANTFEWANVSAQITERFHAKLIHSGLFWETKTGRTFKQDKTAYRQLLESVKSVKKEVLKQNPEHATVAKRLLVMTILLRYLEDRGKEDNDTALKPEELYPEFANGGKSLGSVFATGHSCIDLFRKLASKDDLNGEVFFLDED